MRTNGLSLFSTLAAFGLEQRDDLLKEVAIERARAILERILAFSFVGQLEAMPQHRARILAGEFLDVFEKEGGKLFTNGDWGDPDAYTWQSPTDSVFDGGLIVHGPMVSACVWVEEDD